MFLPTSHSVTWEHELTPVGVSAGHRHSWYLTRGTRGAPSSEIPLLVKTPFVTGRGGEGQDALPGPETALPGPEPFLMGGQGLSQPHARGRCVQVAGSGFCAQCSARTSLPPTPHPACHWEALSKGTLGPPLLWLPLVFLQTDVWDGSLTPWVGLAALRTLV